MGDVEPEVLGMEELLWLEAALRGEEGDGEQGEEGDGGQQASSSRPQSSDGLTMEHMELLECLEDIIEGALNSCGEVVSGVRHEIMAAVFEQIFTRIMAKGGFITVNDEDRSFIHTQVNKLARASRQPQELSSQRRRFDKLDRVVCSVNGDGCAWAAGAVQALDSTEPGISHVTIKFPYVVKLDEPNGSQRFVTVPEDSNDCVRPEVCFGQRADALTWTWTCMLKAERKSSLQNRRFGEGERVACAVEAGSDDNYTDWTAGTVSAVNHPVEGSGTMDGGGTVPYRVVLDCGAAVLVHRDEHWLIRDLELQPAGPRTAADGTRCVARMGKRRSDEDGWQAIDHVTRKVRPHVEESDSEDD